MHIYTAIPNNHNFHSTITKKRHNYTDLREELFRIKKLKTTYVIPLVLPTTSVTLSPPPPHKSYTKAFKN
jgi:hypothetical protein